MDLVDPEDFKTIAVLLNTQESVEKERRMSAVPPGIAKREPAWFRRESMQRDTAMESGFKMSKVGFKENLKEGETDFDTKLKFWIAVRDRFHISKVSETVFPTF